MGQHRYWTREPFLPPCSGSNLRGHSKHIHNKYVLIPGVLHRVVGVLQRVVSRGTPQGYQGYYAGRIDTDTTYPHTAHNDTGIVLGIMSSSLRSIITYLTAPLLLRGECSVWAVVSWPWWCLMFVNPFVFVLFLFCFCLGAPAHSVRSQVKQTWKKS